MEQQSNPKNFFEPQAEPSAAFIAVSQVAPAQSATEIGEADQVPYELVNAVRLHPRAATTKTLQAHSKGWGRKATNKTEWRDRAPSAIAKSCSATEAAKAQAARLQRVGLFCPKTEEGKINMPADKPTIGDTLMLGPGLAKKFKEPVECEIGQGLAPDGGCH